MPGCLKHFRRKVRIYDLPMFITRQWIRQIKKRKNQEEQKKETTKTNTHTQQKKMQLANQIPELFRNIILYFSIACFLVFPCFLCVYLILFSCFLVFKIDKARCGVNIEVHRKKQNIKRNFKNRGSLRFDLSWSTQD